MPIYTPGKLTLRKTWQPMDPDAAAYITAVETADGQSLEEGVKRAIDNFVLGCKEDGVWSAIKASCILAGARTLAGCLVPLAGAAPTNNGFVGIGTDYARKSGLGDSSNTSKYLDTNRKSNDQAQNNISFGVYITNAGTTSTRRIQIGTDYLGNPVDYNSVEAYSDNRYYFYNRGVSNELAAAASSGSSTGFIGLSGNNSSSYTARINSSTVTGNFSSLAPSTSTFKVLARTTPNPALYSTSKVAFYFIGESLDLAKLDSRVTDLMNTLGAAIP